MRHLQLVHPRGIAAENEVEIILRAFDLQELFQAPAPDVDLMLDQALAPHLHGVARGIVAGLAVERDRCAPVAAPHQLLRTDVRIDQRLLVQLGPP